MVFLKFPKAFRFLNFTGVFIVVSLSSGFVNAYVPPSFYAVKALASAHADYSKLRIRSRLTIYDSEGQDSLHLNETLYISGSRNSTVTIRIEDEHHSELNTYYKKLENSGDGRNRGIRPLLYDLLFEKSESSIFSNLLKIGLPLKTESEIYDSSKESLSGNQASEVQQNMLGAYPGKFNEKLNEKSDEKLDEKELEEKLSHTVAHEIEANSYFVRYNGKVVQEIADSQKKIKLWIEKYRPDRNDSMLASGFLWKNPIDQNGESGDMDSLEIRFLNYNMYGSDFKFSYPATIEVYREGGLWVLIETKEISSNDDQVAQHRSSKKYGLASTSGQVKSFLDSYFRWIR